MLIFIYISVLLFTFMVLLYFYEQCYFFPYPFTNLSNKKFYTDIFSKFTVIYVRNYFSENFFLDLTRNYTKKNQADYYYTTKNV